MKYAIGLIIAFGLGALCIVNPTVGLSIVGGLLGLGLLGLGLIGAIYGRSVPAHKFRDLSDE